MSLKFIAFLTVGAAASYYGANYPLVDTPEIQVHKNLFNSSHTFELQKEGLTMTFDKRHEKELEIVTEGLQTLLKASKLAQEKGEPSVEIEQQVTQTVRNTIKIR